jgi:leader peptidase (prepilin peptidase)/N-methyltransferase
VNNEIALIALPFVFVFGASVGSFLNVVAYRLPAGIPLAYPPSRCPHCYHPLGKTENVPILGWLWLRGRCHWCRTAISPRYPLIEMTAALLFCLTFWQFGFTLQTVGYWAFLSWLLALSLIDIDTMTLPNLLTQGGLVAGLAFQLLLGWQRGQIPQFLMLGIASAVLGIWLFDIFLWGGTLLLGQPAMGGGDPKLAAAIGAWLGWKLLLVGSFLACAVGAAIGGGAIALGWISRRQPIPFGPFLALGASLAALWGEAMVEFYLQVFFPN